MGVTIRETFDTSGKPNGWQFQVKVIDGGKTLINQRKKFTDYRAGEGWAYPLNKKVEKGLQKADRGDGGAALREVLQPARPKAAVTLLEATFADITQRYIEEYTLHTSLVVEATAIRLKKSSLGSLVANDLTVEDVLAYARKRRLDDGVVPSTVGNELGRIKAIYKAGVARRWVDTSAFVEIEAGIGEAYEQGLASQSEKRDRVITHEEMTLIVKGIASRFCSNRHVDEPVRCELVVEFAYHSARRISEIMQLRWDGLDVENHMGTIPFSKGKKGKPRVNEVFKMTPEAWAVIEKQRALYGDDDPSGLIFPFKVATVRNAFEETVEKLGIEDARFHDLRHSATTNLFEREFLINGSRRKLTIPEVQLFTLHRSWASLKRYTQLSGKNLKIDWGN